MATDCAPGALRSAPSASRLLPVALCTLPFHETAHNLHTLRGEIAPFSETGTDTATLQVESFDEALYKALGAKAKRDNRSVSQDVVKLIQDFLARPRGSAEDATRTFLSLAGSWEDTRSARQIAEELRKRRRVTKRFRGRQVSLDSIPSEVNGL